MGDELQEHGCFFVSIHLAKRELVAVCNNLSCENFLVGTAVDFKQPFLLDSSDGELHAIGKALTLGLELDFDLRVFLFGISKLERFHLALRKASIGYLLEQGNGLDDVALSGSIGTINDTDLQHRNVVTLLCTGNMRRMGIALTSHKADLSLILDGIYIFKCSSKYHNNVIFLLMLMQR